MRTRLACVLALVSALLLAQLPAAAPAAAAACSTTFPGSGPTPASTEHPVVLVHGWHGEPMPDTATGLRDALGEGWQFFLYDYHRVSNDWADSPRVAGCLADYLLAVSNAHVKALPPPGGRGWPRAGMAEGRTSPAGQRQRRVEPGTARRSCPPTRTEG